MKPGASWSRWPPPRPAACSTCTPASPGPRHSTSTGQTGDATARPAPASRTTHAGPEITGSCC